MKIGDYVYVSDESLLKAKEYRKEKNTSHYAIFEGISSSGKYIASGISWNFAVPERTFSYGDRVITNDGDVGIFITYRESDDECFVIFNTDKPSIKITTCNTTLQDINNIPYDEDIDSNIDMCVNVIRENELNLYKVTKLTLSEVESMLREAGKLTDSLEIIK